MLSFLIIVLVAIHAVLWITLLANLIYLKRSPSRPLSDAAPALSVLIPARNEAANLRRLLPSLLEQNYARFEVIVYDDGSEDATGDVLQSVEDDRLTAIRGHGPPPGWVGKVHALHQATREAKGDHYLFLDADAELSDPDALKRLVERFAALPERSILTGLPRLRGGGNLLVSLVPHVILTSLPWPLVRRFRQAALGALNGQCWMIHANAYHQHEPHAHVADEVLEDVMIGRYLKRQGYTPVLMDVQDTVNIHMYPDVRAAWQGFRKNAYLLLGGSLLSFLVLFTGFAMTFVLSPFIAPAFLLSLYGLKGVTDRYNGFPFWVTALTPVSYVMASALQLDSALHYWTGRASWKGRSVDAW